LAVTAGERRNKMKRRIILVILVVSVLLTPLTVTAMMYRCTSWQIISHTTPECKTVHCGIWDSTALVQDVRMVRSCSYDGAFPKTEFKTVSNHIDCGCEV
jgi:hypothetical protein